MNPAMIIAGGVIAVIGLLLPEQKPTTTEAARKLAASKSKTDEPLKTEEKPTVDIDSVDE